MEARRQWDDILKVLKEKNPSNSNVYLSKLSLRSEGEIKTVLENKD